MIYCLIATVLSLACSALCVALVFRMRGALDEAERRTELRTSKLEWDAGRVREELDAAKAQAYELPTKEQKLASDGLANILAYDIHQARKAVTGDAGNDDSEE
jgi:hypothetical protein